MDWELRLTVNNAGARLDYRKRNGARPKSSPRRPRQGNSNDKMIRILGHKLQLEEELQGLKLNQRRVRHRR